MKPVMKPVEILSDFSSYPDGTIERAFRTGETPELFAEHADLLIAKKLAREIEGSTPAAPAAAAEPETKDTDA